MWENLKSANIKIMSLAFMLLSLLYSIQAGIIVQDEAFFLFAPFKALGSRNDSKSLEKISAKVKTDLEQMTYIFVLDVSKSLIYNNSIPDWYNRETINELNDTIASAQQFTYTPNPAPFELCRIKLAQLLLELENKSVKFEIWELGNIATEEYSNGDLPQKVTIGELKKAFKYLLKVKGNCDLNTDFLNLFRRLCRTHQHSLISSRLNRFKKPSLVLVILSDLIYDIGPRINGDTSLTNDRERKAFFKDREEKLMKKIAEVAEANLIANMILMSGNYSGTPDSDQEYTLHLWKILKNRFLPSRLEKYLISENPTDILYSNIFTEPSLNFYYRNPVHVANGHIVITVPKTGKYRIGLTWERKKTTGQIMTVDYMILGSDDQPLKDDERQIVQGILTTNSDFKDTPLLRPNHKIRLSYSGPPIKGDATPYFKIFFPKADKEAYTIPINFVQILPKEIAWLMVILMIVFALSILFHIILKLYERRHFSKVYRAVVNS